MAIISSRILLHLASLSVAMLSLSSSLLGASMCESGLRDLSELSILRGLSNTG